MLEAQYRELKEDIDGIGRKVDSKASKGDVKASTLTITQRLDRGRNTFLAVLAIAVPLVSALIGALIRGGAG